MRFWILFFILKLTSLSDTLIMVGNYGTFENAVSVSSGREEFIFVSDISLNQIYKFNREGKLLANFGGTGMGENELNEPYSVDATNGLDVLVTDFRNNQLKRLDYDLRFIQLFNFNLYNLMADFSSKIYNPRSVCVIQTGEIFLLCDAGLYKAAKIVNYLEIPVIFASSVAGKGKVQKPSKIVPGVQLDVWILDLFSGDILNYSNSGVFLKSIKNRENYIPISFTSAGNYIYILYNGYVLVYNMKNNSYVQKLSFQHIDELKDISILKYENLILLSKSTLYLYNIIKE